MQVCLSGDMHAAKDFAGKGAGGALGHRCLCARGQTEEESSGWRHVDEAGWKVAGVLRVCGCGGARGTLHVA